MAPKSKRGKERGDFDQTEFVSASAQIRYNEFASSRKFIMERSFYHPGGSLEHIIAARQWEQFCYFSAVAVISVVQKLYANFPETTDFKVYVRGMPMEFNPEVINIFYGLPPATDCFYDVFAPSEGELDEIVAYLTDGRGSWKIRNNKRVNFSSSMLNATSKSWHYFISARLLPSNHLSEVMKERAILNYCIQEMKPIDVGAIIYDTIRTSARGSVISGLASRRSFTRFARMPVFLSLVQKSSLSLLNLLGSHMLMCTGKRRVRVLELLLLLDLLPLPPDLLLLLLMLHLTCGILFVRDTWSIRMSYS